MTVGYNATSGGGTGGFATQIGQNRYGIGSYTYYWIAAQYNLGLLPPATGDAGIGKTPGQSLWSDWGASRLQLTAVAFLIGFNDMLAGTSAAAAWAAYLLILEGAPATATWRPPTANELGPGQPLQ